MEDGALRRLESGDEVRELNDNLRTLDIRTERNRAVPAGDAFTRETEQAIRRFQEQQDTPITGRADPATLESIEHVLQQRRPLQPQNGQPPHGVMQPQVNPQRPDDQEAGRLRDARAFSTGDPDLDRLAAALFANDEAAISRVSTQIEESPQVQQFEQWGCERVAAQEEEGFQRQDMARQTQGPAMRL